MMSDKEKNTNNQQQTSVVHPAVLYVMSGLVICSFLLIVWTVIIEPETRKSTGVVRATNDNELYVQDLKDTARYSILDNRPVMKFEANEAFPYVAVGDTLKYVMPKCNTGSFALVRRVNGERLNKFAKHRRQIAESARIRNMINQKTK
ncbi:MAG: hypothetical protein IKB59_00250 [Alphaproteobacteria bacterium]|nr:hypothetical protein [Alphaproteobacteria bacterium]